MVGGIVKLVRTKVVLNFTGMVWDYNLCFSIVKLFKSAYKTILYIIL